MYSYPQWSLVSEKNLLIPLDLILFQKVDPNLSLCVSQPNAPLHNTTAQVTAQMQKPLSTLHLKIHTHFIPHKRFTYLFFFHCLFFPPVSK